METCFVPAVAAHVFFQSTWATPVEVIVCQHAKRLVGDVQGGIGKEVAIMTLISTFEKLLTYLQVGAQISRNAAFAWKGGNKYWNIFVWLIYVFVQH